MAAFAPVYMLNDSMPLLSAIEEFRMLDPPSLTREYLLDSEDPPFTLVSKIW
jgi:hypothetical protein